jgi:DNA-binding protein HU-beta
MSRITKVDMVRAATHLSKIGLPYAQMTDAYDAIFGTIGDFIKEGHEVTIPGVGRLLPIIKQAGTSRNPATGETVDVPDRVMLKFRVNANFKMQLRELDPKQFRDSGDSDGQVASSKRTSRKATAGGRKGKTTV